MVHLHINVKYANVHARVHKQWNVRGNIQLSTPNTWPAFACFSCFRDTIDIREPAVKWQAKSTTCLGRTAGLRCFWKGVSPNSGIKPTFANTTLVWEQWCWAESLGHCANLTLYSTSVIPQRLLRLLCRASPSFISDCASHARSKERWNGFTN